MDNNICPVTDRKDVIDDCYITIEFGYGSDKDMTTYNFNTVHDSVGKMVLDSIQSLMPKGRSVEDFSRGVMDESFNESWWEELSEIRKSEIRKKWGLK